MLRSPSQIFEVDVPSHGLKWASQEAEGFQSQKAIMYLNKNQKD